MSTIDQQIGKPREVEIVDTGASIRIEQSDGRSAVVHVAYPEDRRRKGAKDLALICVFLALVPLIVWAFVRQGVGSWFAVVVAILACGWIMTNMVRQFFATTRSCVLRTDITGLTIEIFEGRRAKSSHYTRGQIIEIAPAFSFRNGPFKCWLEIETTMSSPIRCLRNVGGDHLARIANALRGPLGMPIRSWP